MYTGTLPPVPFLSTVAKLVQDQASKAGTAASDQASKAGTVIQDRAAKASTVIQDRASKAGAVIQDSAAKAASSTVNMKNRVGALTLGSSFKQKKEDE